MNKAAPETHSAPTSRCVRLFLCILPSFWHEKTSKSSILLTRKSLNCVSVRMLCKFPFSTCNRIILPSALSDSWLFLVGIIYSQTGRPKRCRVKIFLPRSQTFRLALLELLHECFQGFARIRGNVVQPLNWNIPPNDCHGKQAPIFLNTILGVLHDATTVFAATLPTSIIYCLSLLSTLHRNLSVLDLFFDAQSLLVWMIPLNRKGVPSAWNHHILVAGLFF